MVQSQRSQFTVRPIHHVLKTQNLESPDVHVMDVCFCCIVATPVCRIVMSYHLFSERHLASLKTWILRDSLVSRSANWLCLYVPSSVLGPVMRCHSLKEVLGDNH